MNDMLYQVKRVYEDITGEPMPIIKSLPPEKTDIYYLTFPKEDTPGCVELPWPKAMWVDRAFQALAAYYISTKMKRLRSIRSFLIANAGASISAITFLVLLDIVAILIGVPTYGALIGTPIICIITSLIILLAYDFIRWNRLWQALWREWLVRCSHTFPEGAILAGGERA